jgi:Leucine-rich repeat (LRR) protein
MGSLNNLTTLELNNNSLEKFPQEITMLDSLTVLRIEKNDIKELPKEVGQMKQLEELYLADNQLETLPDEFASLKHLVLLDLKHNAFQGLDFASGLTKLKAVEEIDLSYNPLWIFPVELTSIRSLKKFAIDIELRDKEGKNDRFYRLIEQGDIFGFVPLGNGVFVRRESAAIYFSTATI